MTWLAMLKLVPWRWVGYAAAALAVLALGWRVHAWREAYTALPEVEARLSAEVACADGSKCAERVAALTARQEQVSQEVIRGFQDEIDSLRNREPERRIIRVCNSRGDGAVRDAGLAGGTGAGAAPAGLVHGTTEFDPRPLFDLARRADELSAQCRAIIRRDVALAQPGE